MDEYSRGAVLTCAHDDCGCRIRIEAECHCQNAGAPYVCTCGHEMVAVADDAPPA